MIDVENATDLAGDIEAVRREIQSIDTQFTASRQRISEMSATPGYKKTQAYRDECDWRRRATYAKQKLLGDLSNLKVALKESNIVRDKASNDFTRRLKGAAVAAILAYEHGTSSDMGAAIQSLRAALGESAP